MMIEPTETESKETLDHFADTLMSRGMFRLCIIFQHVSFQI
jgi:hypothetical protein